MFDLFRSRDKLVRIMLGAVLLVVAFSMLTYLVPSYDSGGGTNGTVVATVGDDKVMVTDVQRSVQMTMRGGKLPASILPNYIPQIVDGLIVERAIQYQARQLGYQVTDVQLRQTIQQLAPNLFPDGRFVGKDAYAAMLAQRQMTIDDFENDLRKQIMEARVHDIAVEGAIVTPVEIEQVFKTKNEKVKLGYARLTGDKYKAEATPTDAEMRSYYQTNIATFQTPQKKNLVMLVADPAKLGQAIPVTDADLQKVYNQNQEKFRVPEQSKVQHILLMTQGKPATEDAKMKAQADDLIKQLKAGASFKDFVTKYSEDPGKTTNNGEYTVQRNGQMVAEFEKAAFTQKVGEYGVVKTAYGYHILQVVKHDDAHLQTFAEVKDQIATEVKKAQVNQALQAISDKAQSSLQKEPLHPEAVAAALHMDVIHADNYVPGTPIAALGPSPDFDQAVGPLKQGQVSQALALPSGKIVVAEVAGVVPPQPSSFEDVQAQIKASMSKNRLDTVLRKHAQELLDKAKAMGGDLEKAAKSMGLEYRVTDGFTRTDTVLGFGSANYVQQSFLATDGTVFGPVLMPDGTVIAKVIEHQPPDMSKMAADRATIRDQIKMRKAEDERTLFDAGLKDQLIKDGKLKVNKEVIDKLISSYRS